MSRPHLYLSGPMSGCEDFNYPLFQRVAKRLRTMGYEVTNPAENFDGDTSREWTEYLRLDLLQLLGCDAVAVLPGWQNSKGSSLEVHIALALGMDVLDADTLEPISESILEEAHRLIHGARRASYDHPLDNFTRIAKTWEAVFDHEVTPEQVGLCMVGVKLAREAFSHSRDNLTDMAGYAGTVDLVHDERARR